MLAQRNFLLGWRSPAATIDNSLERGELVQIQDVDALYRVGSSSCTLNNSTGSNIAPASAEASSCGVHSLHRWIVRGGEMIFH